MRQQGKTTTPRSCRTRRFMLYSGVEKYVALHSQRQRGSSEATAPRAEPDRHPAPPLPPHSHWCRRRFQHSQPDRHGAAPSRKGVNTRPRLRRHCCGVAHRGRHRHYDRRAKARPPRARSASARRGRVARDALSQFWSSAWRRHCRRYHPASWSVGGELISQFRCDSAIRVDIILIAVGFSGFAGVVFVSCQPSSISLMRSATNEVIMKFRSLSCSRR